MYDLFFQKFNEKVALTAEEEAFVQQYLTPKKLRRKQYFLQEGDVCKSIFVVEKGALQTVAELVQKAGFNPIIAGGLAVSRTLENMTVLLIQLTMKYNYNWVAGWKVLHN